MILKHFVVKKDKKTFTVGPLMMVILEDFLKKINLEKINMFLKIKVPIQR